MKGNIALIAFVFGCVTSGELWGQAQPICGPYKGSTALTPAQECASKCTTTQCSATITLPPEISMPVDCGNPPAGSNMSCACGDGSGAYPDTASCYLHIGGYSVAKKAAVKKQITKVRK